MFCVRPPVCALPRRSHVWEGGTVSLRGSGRSSKQIPCQCKPSYHPFWGNFNRNCLFRWIFAVFFLIPLKDKTSRPAPQEPFLQPEQRAADHRENERPPEVLGRVSNSPADQYMNFSTLPHKQNETGQSLDSTKHRHHAFSWETIDTEPSLFSRILQNPLLLSDSCLHLFLQTQLSVPKIEACAAGRTHYSVAQAVQGYGLRRFHSTEDLQHSLGTSCDSDSDRYCHTSTTIYHLL